MASSHKAWLLGGWAVGCGWRLRVQPGPQCSRCCPVYACRYWRCIARCMFCGVCGSVLARACARVCSISMYVICVMMNFCCKPCSSVRPECWAVEAVQGRCAAGVLRGMVVGDERSDASVCKVVLCSMCCVWRRCGGWPDAVEGALARRAVTPAFEVVTKSVCRSAACSYPHA